MRWGLIALLAMLGCKDEAPPVDTGDTDSPIVDTSDVPRVQDEGSLALVRTHDELGRIDSKQVTGLFLTDNAGIFNLGACLVSDLVPCLQQLPADVDNWVPFDPTLTLAPNSTTGRYVGLDVPMGPYTAVYYTQNETLPSRYWADVTEESNYNGPAGIVLGGMWGDWNTTVTIPSKFAPQAPALAEALLFSDASEPIAFEWTPTEDPDSLIVLTVWAENTTGGAHRLYLLEDDGSFELDPATLDLATFTRSGESLEVTFVLSQWSYVQHEVGDNILDTLVTSDQPYRAVYTNVGSRTPLPQLTCATVDAEPPLQSGTYYGYNNNDSETTVPSTCYSGGATGSGRDNVLPVTLQPREYLRASLRGRRNDVTLHLQRTCGDANSCVSAGDQYYSNKAERISYYNRSERAQNLYLWADNRYTGQGGAYSLDLEISPTFEIEVGDSCVEAQGLPLTPPGQYYGTLAGNYSFGNPGSGGCTGTNLPGADGMVRIEVPANQTLNAAVSASVGEDPALYLVFNCLDIIGTCLEGSDGTGQAETIQYTNTTAGSQGVYLVIDSQSQVTDFLLDFTVQ